MMKFLHYTVALCWLLVLIGPPAHAEDITGSMRVFDGGAVWINAQWVYLAGVDGPYAHDECNAQGVTWQCGLAAQAWLSDITSGLRFNCSLETHANDTRRHATCTEIDRETGEILQNSDSINRLWVKAGWVLATKGGGYETDEQAARDAGAGMWALSVPASREPAPAIVSGHAQVLDGNTLEISGVRLRLFGSDAPELAHQCVFAGSRYECGYYARSHLATLIQGQEVSCEMAQQPRNLARCRTLIDGSEIAERMISDGWALADRDVTEDFVQAELSARGAGVGLWASTFVLPKRWRLGRR